MYMQSDHKGAWIDSEKSTSSKETKTTHPITLAHIRQLLAVKVDWNRFFRLVDSLGTSLNSRKDRFDKGSILEFGVAMYSRRCIDWVDDDHHDLELRRPTMKCRIEMKFGTDMLTQPKRRGFPKTISARLSNVLGEDSRDRQRKFKAQFADYLILADHDRIVVLPKSFVLKHRKFKADCIELKAPGKQVAKGLVFERTSGISNGTPRVCDFHRRKIALMKAVVRDNK